MTNQSRVEPKRLAPPVRTILLYAADGLAVLRGDWSASGRPMTPGADIWSPTFYDLIHEADGMQNLQSLAETGMKAWGLAGDYLECLRAAFEDITFKARALAEIEEFGYQTPNQPKARLSLMNMPAPVRSITP